MISANVICGTDAHGYRRQANGFYGSKGISGYIPEGYTLLERKFMRAVQKAGRAYDKTDKTKPGVDLREWEKYRWTYHAKGICSSPLRAI